ncbi:MAG: hypothetical protein M2R45_00731 [Verrucomicrobia subdivision 3 bacterium]|nr:hypothetical protein [Limisphaerales bacterium]MCS1414386.1 hypothetical protein [Limisphaerales bacterium]
MDPAKKDPAPNADARRVWLWALFAGFFVATAILKFSIPAILADRADPLETLIEWVFYPWPNLLGYGLLAALALTAARSFRANANAPRWFLFIPALWLIWQVLSTANTVDMQLTRATLAHFTSTMMLFYLGYFVLSQEAKLRGFRSAVLVGYLLVLWSGLEQHFGGLQATREMIYSDPNWQQLPPEYLEKIAKDRIFSTLFYPNAFAGGLILLTPMCALALWHATARLQIPSRTLIVGVMVLSALACLYWTESKSGWLVSLALVMVYLLQSRRPKWIKAACLAVVLIGGLAGFFWKYAGYFGKGAASVAARFDYWNAAWSTAKANPLFGTGPGTFKRAYSKIKPPDAEMAWLAHNDYLQQASDSGFLSAGLYAGFIGFGLYRARQSLGMNPMRLAVWFGLLGFALQSFVEFGLHIPALAWPFFLLLGWLAGQSNPNNAATDTD